MPIWNGYIIESVTCQISEYKWKATNEYTLEIKASVSIVTVKYYLFS